MIKIKSFLKENKQIFWFLGFAVVGIIYFGSKLIVSDYTYIHMGIDDKIPFIPAFIIPYVLWYIYVPAPMIYLCFKDKFAFKKQIITMFSGMFLCSVGFLVFPTAINFRPTAEGDGFILWLCRFIYANDTPSANVFPSLHCFEALAIHLTAFTGGPLKKYVPLRIISAVLAVTICFSTVFVKQHSFADLISGCLLALFIFVTVERYYILKGNNNG